MGAPHCSLNEIPEVTAFPPPPLSEAPLQWPGTTSQQIQHLAWISLGRSGQVSRCSRTCLLPGPDLPSLFLPLLYLLPHFSPCSHRMSVTCSLFTSFLGLSAVVPMLETLLLFPSHGPSKLCTKCLSGSDRTLGSDIEHSVLALRCLP